MNKEYYIKLSARIDDSQKTTTELNKQIKDMETKLQKLELKVDAKGIKAASNEFNTLDGALSKVGLTSKQLQDSFTDVKTKLTSSSKEVVQYKNNLGQVVEVTTRLNNGQKTYSATTTTLNSSLAKNVTSISNLNAQYKTQDEILRNLKVDLSEYQKISSQVNSDGSLIERWTNNSGKIVTLNGKMIDGQTKYIGSLKEVDSAVEVNAKQADKWHYSWSKAFQSFTTYMSVTTVFYQTIGAIRSMITEVTDLDSALVELRKVTDLEGASLENFTEKAYDAAANVAKTGTEMVNAATEFAKAGYGEDQILKLGELALMYTNIADEEVSAAEAAEFMIAQMKAFNIEATDAEHIIDAVNEVANRYAVSSADIANNLGKSSAVMANAGNSYEEMIGILTAGTEITRNASKVSNGLKTITLRLQGMDEAGEESLELVAQMEGLFTKLGLSMYKADGSLKSTYELLKDLAPVYRDATTAQKAYITETIAGKYQAQNAAAILNNFEVAIEATETAMNSQGSAMNENAKVMDSIEGKLNSLKSAWEELSNNLIDSELVKFVIDLGTSILELANSGIGQFIIKSSLVVIGLTLLDKILGLTIVKVKGFKKDITTATLALMGYTKEAKKTAAANVVLGNSFDAAGKKGVKSSKTVSSGFMALLPVLKSVGKALSSFFATPLGIAAAIIGAVAGGIYAHKKSIEKQKQEMIKSVSEEASALDKSAKDIDSTIDKFQDLRKTLSDDKTSYKEAAAAREELIKIQNELKKKYGEEAADIDLVTGSIETQIEKLKALKQEQAKDYIKDNKTGYNEAKNEVYGKNKHSREMLVGSGYNDNRDFDYLEKIGQITEKEAKEYKERLKQAEQFDKDIEKIISKRAKGNVTQDANGFFGFTTENVDNSKKILEDLKEYYLENEDEIIKSGIMTQESFDNKLKLIDTELDKIDEEFGGSYKAIEEYESKMKDAAGWESFKEKLADLAKTEGLNKENVKELLGQFPGLEDALTKNKISISDLVKDYQNLDTVYDKLMKDNKGLEKTMADITLDGVVSEDEVEKLKKLFPDLEEQLEGTGMSLDDFIDRFPELLSESTGTFSSISSELDNLQDAYSTVTDALAEYNEMGYFSVDTAQALLDMEPQYLAALMDENGAIRDNTDMFKTLALARLDEMEASEMQRHIEALQKLALTDEAGAAQLAASSINAHKNAMAGQEVNAAALRSQIQQNINKFNEEAAAAMKAALAAEDARHKRNKSVIDKTRLGVISNTGYAFTGSSGGSGGSGGSGRSGRSGRSSKSEKEWWEKQFDSLKDKFKYNEITITTYINSLSKLVGKLKKGSEAWRKVNEELQKQRLAKVEDDYKRGTISLDTYIKKLKQLIKAYKKGTEAWNDLADKIKDALQDKADLQKDRYETALDSAISIIDREIDKLDKLKDEQEEYYDKLIADKEKANEETERELELARLQEALANAQKEKTKRVWREGIGKKSADVKDNYIGQMLEIVKTEVRLNLRWCVYG